MDKKQLYKPQIERVFQIVDAKAKEAGRSLNLYVIGGAALVLNTNHRPTAQDIDVGLAGPYSQKNQDDRYFLHNATADVSREWGFDIFHKPLSDDDFQKTLFDFEASYSLSKLFEAPGKYFDRFPLHDVSPEKTGLNVYLLKKDLQLLLKLTRLSPSTKDYRDMWNLGAELGISDQNGLQRLWDAHKNILSVESLMDTENTRTGKLKKKWEDIVKHKDASDDAPAHGPVSPLRQSLTSLLQHIGL